VTQGDFQAILVGDLLALRSQPVLRVRRARSGPQIAMVEADEGIAIIPSYGLAASRNRKVLMSRLVSPVAEVGLHLISNRGQKLPPVVDEFTEFLKHYIAGWAGRFGAL
jgi:DNA-binding transcriptional LysR family regulator